MTSIDERLLENKMTQIEQARIWSPRVISKFETLIRSGDEVSVYRANPLAFARDRGVAEPESIDLFLHAARAGLVDMHWDILCPHSGLVLESFGKLRALRSHLSAGCAISMVRPSSTTSSRFLSPSLRKSGASRCTTSTTSRSKICTGS